MTDHKVITATPFAFTKAHAEVMDAVENRLFDVMGEAIDNTGGDEGRDLTGSERIIWQSLVEARGKLGIALRNLNTILAKK